MIIFLVLFVWVWVTVLCNFLSVWRTFNILLVINYLSIWVYLFLKNVFSGYRFLGWQLFSFVIWMSSAFFAIIVCNENLADKLRLSLSVTGWFSFCAFKIFFLSSGFQCFTMMCLGVDFLFLSSATQSLRLTSFSEFYIHLLCFSTPKFPFGSSL